MRGWPPTVGERNRLQVRGYDEFVDAVGRHDGHMMVGAGPGLWTRWDLVAAGLHHFYPVVPYDGKQAQPIGCCHTSAAHTHDGMGRTRKVGERRTPDWVSNDRYEGIV